MMANNPLETVCVIGLGYIGLPTAAVLAQAGKRVTGVDLNESVVESVNNGRVPFVEEGLETVVAGAVARERLSAQTTTPLADAYIVAVPTPFKDGHAADLSFVESAARSIATQLEGGELIILESTSPPGHGPLCRAGPSHLGLLLPCSGAGTAGPDHDRDGRQRPHRRRHHHGGLGAHP